MEKFIFEKKYVLSPEFCNEIIYFYENQDKTKILNNKSNICDFEYIIINNYEYIQNFNREIINILNKYINTYLDKKTEFILDNTYKINKLNKNKGFKNLCHDFILKENKIYSYLIFFIFLNSDDNYLIVNNIKIKPEIGKILLFPCGWCFPYEYLKSNNNNYFISGYIYNKF